MLSTCQPRTAPPAPPVVVLSPCQKCEACVRTMQSVVATTNTLADRFFIGDAVFEACKQHWKDTPATNKDLACSQLRKDIINSQGGITGKRAGLICSFMSECDAATLGTSCSIAASNTTAGTLDLCTVEGVRNATRVQGILATAGVCFLLCSCVGVIPGCRACKACHCCLTAARFLA